MHEFFAMNGYGAYIWSAYGVAGFILCAVVAVTLVRHARLKKLESRLDRHDA